MMLTLMTSPTIRHTKTNTHGEVGVPCNVKYNYTMRNLRVQINEVRQVDKSFFEGIGQ